MIISSVDSKKRNRIYASINPPKQGTLFLFCVYSTFDTVNQAGLFWVDWLPFCANLKRIPLDSNSLIIGRTSDPPTTQMAPPEARLSITVNPFPQRSVMKISVPFLFP